MSDTKSELEQDLLTLAMTVVPKIEYLDLKEKHERVLQMLDIAEGAMTNCRMQFADMMSRVKAPDAWMIQELDEALDHIKGLKK